MEMPRDWTERHIKELIEKYGGSGGSDGSVNGIPIFSKLRSVQVSEIAPPQEPIYSQYPNIAKIDYIGGGAGDWKDLVSQYLVGYNIPVYVGDGFEFKGYHSGSSGIGDLNDIYDYDYETIIGGNDEVTVSLTAMGVHNSYSYIMIDQAPLINFPVPHSEQGGVFGFKGADLMPTLLRDIGFFREIDRPDGLSGTWTGMYNTSPLHPDNTVTHRLYLITTNAGLPISTESANYYNLNPDFKYRNDGGDEVAISDLDVSSFGVVCIDFQKLEHRFEYPHFMIGISFYDNRERATIMNVYEGDVYTMTFKDVLIKRR